MDDLISRKSVLKAIEKLHVYGFATIGEDDLKEAIEKLKTVTPKEKTAAWVGIDAEPHDIYECNACGWLLYYEDRTDFKYCPNCGARMVSE